MKGRKNNLKQVLAQISLGILESVEKKKKWVVGNNGCQGYSRWKKKFLETQVEMGCWKTSLISKIVKFWSSVRNNTTEESVSWWEDVREQQTLQ